MEADIHGVKLSSLPTSKVSDKDLATDKQRKAMHDKKEIADKLRLDKTAEQEAIETRYQDAHSHMSSLEEELTKQALLEYRQLNDPGQRTRMFSLEEQLLFPAALSPAGPEWMFLPAPVTAGINGN